MTPAQPPALPRQPPPWSSGPDPASTALVSWVGPPTAATPSVDTRPAPRHRLAQAWQRQPHTRGGRKAGCASLRGGRGLACRCGRWTRSRLRRASEGRRVWARLRLCARRKACCSQPRHTAPPSAVAHSPRCGGTAPPTPARLTAGTMGFASAASWPTTEQPRSAACR